jgi:hypothetical protein
MVLFFGLASLVAVIPRFVLWDIPGIRPSVSSRSVLELLLDTLDLIPGMSHNTNLGITATRDARPKNSAIAAKQVQELCNKFYRRF